MRPYYDDPDEFDFSDSMAVNRIRREQQREERRSMNRRFHSRSSGTRYDECEDLYEYDRYDDDIGFDRSRKEDFDHRPRPGRDH